MLYINVGKNIPLVKTGSTKKGSLKNTSSSGGYLKERLKNRAA